ncbi:hypothetical protein [Arcobacter sp. F2176]|uniref:hypothetical protein n=1 Tax=Arcobacter sp. F2176 TaxID=2044511 RepID=UPI00100BEFE3|nr:hypothetical protein [Arcobacter sp. F2176]RXJ82154.1 hypothetical protein CRU95_04515 [Arcobacter sp. F2176]
MFGNLIIGLLAILGLMSGIAISIFRHKIEKQGLEKVPYRIFIKGAFRHAKKYKRKSQPENELS